MSERAKQFLTELRLTQRANVHVSVEVLREALEEAQLLAVEVTVTRIVEELVKQDAVLPDTLESLKQIIADFRAEKLS